MPLAERYLHWQRAADEELLNYTPEPWLARLSLPEDTASTPILVVGEPRDELSRLDA
jgi:hypothetical protein